MIRVIAILASIMAGCHRVEDVSHRQAYSVKINRTFRLNENCELWRQSSRFAKYTILAPVGKSDANEGKLPIGTLVVIEKIVKERQRPLLRSPEFEEVETDYAIVRLPHPNNRNESVTATVMFGYLENLGTGNDLNQP